MGICTETWAFRLNYSFQYMYAGSFVKTYVGIGGKCWQNTILIYFMCEAAFRRLQSMRITEDQILNMAQMNIVA